MSVVPIYSAQGIRAVCRLYYSWSGFPKRGSVWRTHLSGDVLRRAQEGWSADGIKLLERSATEERIQLLFSAGPDVSPETLAARAKGRLQNALRSSGQSMAFARNFSVRSVGENRRTTVVHHIKQQLNKAELADSSYRDDLALFHWSDPNCDWELPLQTHSGEYRCSHHIVLVTSDRWRMDGESTARLIRDACLGTARKHGYRLGEMSIMPDHWLCGAPHNRCNV